MFTLTKQPQDIDRSGQAGVLRKNLTDTQQKRCSIVGEFGDLNIEAVRIAYVEAMILDHIIPGANANANRLESAFMNLPSSTMNKVIATRGKLYEAYRKNAALLLEGCNNFYVF
jgi:succinyl-CoA synthetase beta subunit